MRPASLRHAFIGMYLTVGIVLLVESLRTLVHAVFASRGQGAPRGPRCSGDGRRALIPVASDVTPRRWDPRCNPPDRGRGARPTRRVPKRTARGCGGRALHQHSGFHPISRLDHPEPPGLFQATILEPAGRYSEARTRPEAPLALRVSDYPALARGGAARGFPVFVLSSGR